MSDDGDGRNVTVVESHMSWGRSMLHYQRNSHPLGQEANRRQAFTLSSGEFIGMVDDDDALEPEHLEKTVTALVEHPLCGFVANDQLVVDYNGDPLSCATARASKQYGRQNMVTGVYTDVLLRQLTATSFPLSGTLFRRQALDRVGFIPQNSGLVCDFALYLELGAARIAGYYIAERLSRYRIHTKQASGHHLRLKGDTLRVLDSLAGRRDLRADEAEALARRFRQTVVELAVAHAHARNRSGALRVLRRYGSHGWGLVPPRRVAVLVALLAGASRRSSSQTGLPDECDW